MSAAQNEPVDVEWAAEDVDEIAHLLVDRHGVKGATKRLLQTASRIKMLYPEDDSE